MAKINFKKQLYSYKSKSYGKKMKLLETFFL